MGAVVVLGSATAGYYLRLSGDGHQHNHTDKLEHSPEATAEQNVPVRHVVLHLSDEMKFNPSNWEAKAGEQLRIVVINTGKLKHELVLGTDKELAQHAQEMKASNNHHHMHTNALSLEPGMVGSILWKFDKSGLYGMACFEPGHYEAGMKGVVVVK